MAGDPISVGAVARDLRAAFAAMPRPMKQMAVMMMFQWYAMFAYWQFVVHALARSVYGTADPLSAGFRDAALLNGQLGGLYNFVAFAVALTMVPLVRRVGARPVHAAAVAASGLAMIALPSITNPLWLALPMIGIGIGWASMMGNPYVLLANCIPAERTGIYMGIFHMFIVVTMLNESVTMPLLYRPLLGGDPRNVLILAGLMMLAAAAATLVVRVERPAPVPLRA